MATATLPDSILCLKGKPMNATRILTRSALAVALATLAACQTAPVQQDAATGPSDATTATTAPEASTEAPVQAAAEQGVPVAVFLADITEQQGWRAVPIGADSTLYLDPQPIITRDDLTGVQAGSNQQGVGLLALMLSDDAKSRVQDLTSRYPNRRLALVVGRTLMAAPSYAEPVDTGQLIFPVGTEDNATAAARAIAGVSEDGAATGGMGGGASAPGMTGGSTGSGLSGTSGSGTTGASGLRQ